MQSPVQRLIRERVRVLIQGAARLNVHIAGFAGSLSRWLGRSGASAILDGFDWTHDYEMTKDRVGRELEGPFVSPHVAIQMAASAYERSRRYSARRGDSYRPIIALGATAALASSRRRRGKDRLVACVRTAEGFWGIDIEMAKTEYLWSDPTKDSSLSHEERASRCLQDQHLRDVRRAEQINLIDRLLLNLILWAADLPQIPILQDRFTGDALTREIEVMPTVTLEPTRLDEDPEELFDLVFWHEGDVVPIDRLDWQAYCVLPGSFDPLHHGHIDLAKWMEQMTGGKVIFQISKHHPVKPELAFDDDALRDRVRQFTFRHPIVVTRHDGLYFDKAKRFPGAAIVMGADALVHMLNPSFYGGVEALHARLMECNQMGTQFWVADREVDGVMYSLETTEGIPPEFRHLFRHLSHINTISSSEIRAQSPD